MKKRYFKVIMGFVLVSVFIWGSAPYLLRAFSACLVYETALKPADVIVVLSGDASGRRVKKAVLLYQQQLAPRLVMTGDSFYSSSVPQLMASYASQLGVPRDHIYLEEQSTSTYDHTQYVRPILEKLDVRSVILVTSKHHTRRSFWIFNKMWRSYDVNLMIVGSDDNVDDRVWWQNYNMIELVLMEWAKTVWYRLYF